MFVNLVRAALVLLTVTAHAARPTGCIPLLEAHLETTESAPGAFVPFLLRQRPGATLVAHFYFFKAPQTGPSADEFDVFNEDGLASIGVVSGTREDLIAKSANLASRFGSNVTFQVLGGRVDQAFTLAPATKRLDVGDDLKPLEKALAAKDFDGLVVQDTVGRTRNEVLPARALDGVDAKILAELGIDVLDGGATAWAKASRQGRKTTRATIFRGPGYVITNVAAFQTLGRMAALDVAGRAISPALAATLPACVDEPCEILEPFPTHVTDPVEAFRFLVRMNENSGTDVMSANALETLVTRAFQTYAPGEPVVLGKIMKMDGRLLANDAVYPNPNAKRRLADVWSVLVTKVLARTPAPTPPSPPPVTPPTAKAPRRQPAKPTPAPAPKPAPAPEPAPAPAPKPAPAPAPAPESAPIKRAPVAGAAKAAVSNRVDYVTAFKMFSVLAKHKALVAPSQKNGVKRALLDTLYKFKSHIGRDYTVARTEVQNLDISPNAFTLVRNGNARATEALVAGWRILLRATKDPNAEGKITLATVATTDERLDALLAGGPIKITRVLGTRRLESPGKPLPLLMTEAVIQQLGEFGLSDDDIRAMLIQWHSVRETGLPGKPEQPWTVLIPPERNKIARRGGGIIAELTGSTITGVYRDLELEMDFYGRLANRQDLAETTLKVKFAAEGKLTHVRIPAGLQAELQLKNISLGKVEEILARSPRRSVPGPQGTCFELREKDSDEVYFACFADFSKRHQDTTLLEFSPRPGGATAH